MKKWKKEGLKSVSFYWRKKVCCRNLLLTPGPARGGKNPTSHNWAQPHAEQLMIDLRSKFASATDTRDPPRPRQPPHKTDTLYKLLGRRGLNSLLEPLLGRAPEGLCSKCLLSAKEPPRRENWALSPRGTCAGGNEREHPAEETVYERRWVATQSTYTQEGG